VRLLAERSVAYPASRVDKNLVLVNYSTHVLLTSFDKEGDCSCILSDATHEERGHIYNI
jgi:hypothetical protein